MEKKRQEEGRMKYEKMKKYKESQLRRIRGVKRETFEKMVEILSKAEENRA